MLPYKKGKFYKNYFVWLLVVVLVVGCIYVLAHVPIYMGAYTCLLMLRFLIFLETWSFTKPKAHGFGLAGWPVSPRDPPVSTPSTKIIDMPHPVFTWALQI